MKLMKQVFGVLLIAMAMIACKNTEYKKTKDGFPYKVFGNGKGEKIVRGSIVRYHMTNKLEDSLLGTSYGAPSRWIGIPKDGELTGINQILMDAHKGDSVLIIQPVDSLLTKPGAAQDSFLLANKGKQLKTIIKVIEVYNNEEEARAVFEKENIESFYKMPGNTEQKKKDEAEIEAYLKANNITNTKRTPWGAYVQSLSAGNGQKAKTGQFMMLRYTGKTLAGVQFDSNNKPGAPLLPMQVGAGGTIPGFEDAVKQLSKGEKALIYIPSVVGYGAQGKQPAIKANENLLFEIEVVDITDQQPAPPPMPMPDSTRK